MGSSSGYLAIQCQGSLSTLQFESLVVDKLDSDFNTLFVREFFELELFNTNKHHQTEMSIFGAFVPQLAKVMLFAIQA